MPEQPAPVVDRAAVAAALAGLDREALAGARWFGAKGRAISGIDLDEAFVLDPEAPHVLAVATFTLDDRSRQRYAIALTGSPLREAEPGDGAWRALAVAMAEGRTIAALPGATPKTRPAGRTGTMPAAAGAPSATAGTMPAAAGPDASPERAAAPRAPVTAALVCRPARAMPDPDDLADERDLGADQSNTGVVIGERILLKAYRRLQPGLNPDLELTAFLSEDAAFAAVPPLAGFAELIEAAGGGSATTVAMAQQFVADGADAFETLAEALVGWIEAPGSVSLEVATEVAADLGALTAGLHAALVDGRGQPDMTPREATRAELRAWPATARANLERALDVAPGEAGDTVRTLAPAVAEVLTVLEALPSVPTLQRTHGDLHLGQILIAPDGFRVVDFEGEPLSSPEERRALRHPLRDVASMLRSLDHVGRSAARRARTRAGDAPREHAGLDVDDWIVRARERFLEAYRDGLREARVWPDIDPDLLRAFEIDKELYEFAYAATYLPTWLYAPTEGMRALLRDVTATTDGGAR